MGIHQVCVVLSIFTFCVGYHRVPSSTITTTNCKKYHVKVIRKLTDESELESH